MVLMTTLIPSSFVSAQSHPEATGVEIKEMSLVEPLQAVETPLAESLPIIEPPKAPAGPNTYEAGNCTWYVASKLPVPNTWGNANTWASRATSDRFTVSSTPRVGAIAQTSRGSFGHVAIVTAVSGSTITVTEMNVRGLGVVSTGTYPASDYTYIYV